MSNISLYKSRLPVAEGISEEDAKLWNVLCEQTFPNAKTPESIKLALDYCRARKLDILKKPVSIVPMWNSSLGKEVETVWPGINEVQITAARTGKYAGMDMPVFGPTIKKSFKGSKKTKSGWENVEFELEYPEWCAVTVYKFVDGQKCAFVEPVYWLEAYASVGKDRLPNDMWTKRPFGQVIKTAKAFSLRAAFPEEGDYTAEEMEGKELSTGGVAVESPPIKDVTPPKTAPMLPEAPIDPETGELLPPHVITSELTDDGSVDWVDYGRNIVAALNSATNSDILYQWLNVNHASLEEMKEKASKLYSRVLDRVAKKSEEFEVKEEEA